LQTKLRNFKYENEVCPSVWLRNLETDETTDQETVDIHQKVFKEDPEYLLTRSHFNQRTMGKDTLESYRRTVKMDWAYAMEA